MREFLVSALAFIVLVGVMVIVHELGHFIVAKLFKVRVEAFSFGFGPRLFGFKYGDTDYKVCLLPLGGFVKVNDWNQFEIIARGEAPVDLHGNRHWQQTAARIAALGTPPPPLVLTEGES